MSSYSHPKVVSQGLTFDDVLLLPQYSTVLPSQAICATELSPHLKLDIPFLSAAMDTVTESKMAIALSEMGCLGVLHRNLSPEEQANEVKKVKEKNGRCGAAVGTSQTDWEDRIPRLLETGVDLLVLDTAHGHSQKVLDTVKHIQKIRKKDDRVTLCVGNIATGAAALALAEAGADVVKVGIGPGSICTTRIVAGIGVPQLSAVLEVADALQKSSVKIIADGGLRFSGDIVKALAAGAHAVMVGSMLAGTDETPGEKVHVNGKYFKRYRGMGSIGAMRKGSKDRYFQSDQDDKKLVPEGIEGQVSYRGPVAEIIHQLCGGLRAGMGYVGAKNLIELREKAQFVQMSPASQRESHVHSVAMTQESPNYSQHR